MQISLHYDDKTAKFLSFTDVINLYYPEITEYFENPVILGIVSKASVLQIVIAGHFTDIVIIIVSIQLSKRFRFLAYKMKKILELGVSTAIAKGMRGCILIKLH